jgi:hypothetical protein
MTLIFNILTATEGKNEMESILELIRYLLHEIMPGGCFPTEFTHMKQNIDRPTDPSDLVHMFIELDEKRNN